MNIKYNKQDFELIVEKKKTVEQIALKYAVCPATLKRQMNRAGYYLNKRKILIISPYKLIECNGISECARELNVSTATIQNALKGKRIKILEELEITLKEIKSDE